MTETAETRALLAFVSYSWNSTAHIDWVLQLATRLRSDGVDLVLDRWDTPLGSDLSLFMERPGGTAYRVLASTSLRWLANKLANATTAQQYQAVFE